MEGSRDLQFYLKMIITNIAKDIGSNNIWLSQHSDETKREK